MHSMNLCIMNVIPMQYIRHIVTLSCGLQLHRFADIHNILLSSEYHIIIRSVTIIVSQYITIQKCNNMYCGWWQFVSWIVHPKYKKKNIVW